jgi:hypothetical protein
MFGVARNHALRQCHHLCYVTIRELVDHVFALALDPNESAPAQTSQVIADAALRDAELLDDFPNRERSPQQRTQYPQPRFVREPGKKTGIEAIRSILLLRLAAFNCTLHRSKISCAADIFNGAASRDARPIVLMVRPV